MIPKKQTGHDAPATGANDPAEDREAEENRKHGGKVKHHTKRARGGHMPAHEEKKHEEEKHEAAHHPRKRGGHVPGHMAKHRPDRRARGGGADMHPESSAGNMSMPAYERGHQGTDEGGEGRDSRGANKG